MCRINIGSKNIVGSLNKSEFKQLLSLATKELYFIFNGFLGKQIDGVAMGSPLGPTLVMLSFVFMKKMVRTMSWGI